MTLADRQFLRAHRVGAWAGLLVVGLLVSWLSGAVVLELQLIAGRSPRYTPLREAVPVLVAVLGAGMLAPSLWSWEHGAPDARVRRRAAALATAGCIGPGVTSWAAVLWLPEGARWWDVGWNVLVVAAVALAATAALGPAAGPAVGLAFYSAVVACQQVLPEVAPLLPLSGTTAADRPRVVEGVVAVAVAAAVWAVTLGRSRLAQRLSRGERG